MSKFYNSTIDLCNFQTGLQNNIDNSCCSVSGGFVSSHRQTIGKSICELEGYGDWSKRGGYFGSCLNISWERVRTIDNWN